MSIDGVEIGCLIKETEMNVRASLEPGPMQMWRRSLAEFGGGGHIMAAGCSLKIPIDEVEKGILAPKLQEAL